MTPDLPGKNTYGSHSALLDYSMIAAIYFGLDNGDAATQQLSYTCPSGNCTFPPFASLAVCSSCSDVSNMVQGGYIEFESDAYNGPIGQYNTAASSYKVLEYTLLPHRLFHINNEDGFANQSGYKLDSTSGFGFETMTSYSTSHPYLTIINTENQLLLQAITTMQPGEEYLNNSVPWNQSSIIATECALTLCVKIYNSSVNSQKLTENDMSSWSIPDLESYRPKAQSEQPVDVRLNSPSDPALGNSTWNPLYNPSWVQRTDISLKLPSELNTSLPSSLTLSDSIRFNMSQKDIDAMQTFFSSLNPPPTNDSALDTLPQFCILYNGTNLTKSDLMRAICNTDNIGDSFSRLARSITLSMRNYETTRAGSPGTSPFVDGTTMVYLNYFSINWLYFILPCAMSLFAMVVLVAAIAKSARSATAVWKNSSLATLFHGLDPEALETVDRIVRVVDRRDHGDIEDVCGKTVLVRLLDGDDGIKLRA